MRVSPLHLDRDMLSARSLALQGFLTAVTEARLFSGSFGDRNARVDRYICEQPRLGGIGTGGPSRTPAGRNRAWRRISDPIG